MVQCGIAITYEEELKKNPELKESDVQILREWCAKQPHLPKISDVQLTVFLHKKKFNVEKTKTFIESYYTLRTHSPEFFSNRDPVGSRELRTIFKAFACVPLKKPSHDGHKILYTKIMDPDPAHYNYNAVAKYIGMYYDLEIYTEGSHAGYIVVCNAQGFTLAHASRCTPMTLKKSLLYLQRASPLHLKGIHVINTIHFHSSAQSLAKIIPLDGLPNDDGGNGGNLVNLMAESVKWLEDNRAWFQTEEATMRVNESLRLGKSKTSTDLLGIEGSFKQLEVD